MRADDSRLLGIPRSRPIITMIYPHHGGVLQDCPALSGEVSFSPLTDLRITLSPSTSVARVSPETSKGITDLLLPGASSKSPLLVSVREGPFPLRSR
jgi:hypothetical protein